MAPFGKTAFLDDTMKPARVCNVVQKYGCFNGRICRLGKKGTCYFSFDFSSASMDITEKLYVP